MLISRALAALQVSLVFFLLSFAHHSKVAVFFFLSQRLGLEMLLTYRLPTCKPV